MTQSELKKWLQYDPDTGVFVWKMRPGYRVRVGDVAGCNKGNGYLQIQVGRQKHLAHRLAWLYMHGEWPEQIDHINHVRDDNRICNLRAADHATNNKNRSLNKNNTSGTSGVDWKHLAGKWRVRIKVQNKYKHVGYFANKQDAIEARKKAEVQYGFHSNHGTAACG